MYMGTGINMLGGRGIVVICVCLCVVTYMYLQLRKDGYILLYYIILYLLFTPYGAAQLRAVRHGFKKPRFLGFLKKLKKLKKSEFRFLGF